jgi:hypothetical protein
MAHRRTAISIFLSALLAMSMLGLTFLPMAWFARCLLSNCSCCSLLTAARPERLPDKVPASPGLLPSSFFPHHHTPQDAINKFLLLACVCSYIPGSYSVCSLFFPSGGGRPLHNVLTFIFRILTEDPTVRFTIFSPMFFLKFMPDVLSLPGCSCCLKSQFLVPLLRLCLARHLFSNLHAFGVVYNIILAWPLMTASLAWCRNGMVGQPSSGSGKLLPRSIIALGLFLQLPVVPYG